VGISSFPPFLCARKGVHSVVLEGMARERERLVMDGGEEGKRKGEEVDICSGRSEEDGEEERGV
jgi:hypothetical protein